MTIYNWHWHFEWMENNNLLVKLEYCSQVCAVLSLNLTCTDVTVTTCYMCLCTVRSIIVVQHVQDCLIAMTAPKWWDEDLFVYTCSFMMVELATFIIWVCGEFDSLRSGALNHSTLLPLYKHTVKMSLQEWPRLTNTQQSRKNIYRDHRLLFHCRCIESTASTAETLPHWYTMLLDPTQWFFYMNSLPTDPHNIRCNVGKLRVQTA